MSCLLGFVCFDYLLGVGTCEALYMAKGLVTILLVIPYFGGASYVYKSFIRPCTKTVLLLPRNFGFVLSGQEDNILYASKGKGNFDGSRESEKVVICEEPERGEGEVESRTILGNFLRFKMDGADRQIRRRRSLNERLELKEIGCCGATCGAFRPSAMEDEEQQEEEERRGQVEEGRGGFYGGEPVGGSSPASSPRQILPSPIPIARTSPRRRDHRRRIGTLRRAEREKSVSCHDMEGKCSTWPSSVKRVQQKWSCALCLVNMTSSKCLTAHLEGKKHKAKKEEFRADKITKPVILCNWRKPKLGWTKLNTDGSIDKENEGLGGLLRDHGGNPICAFVSKSTEGDVFLVELWAIWKGLVLALILGIKVIWIESDSLSVVNTIKRDQPYCPKAKSCLYHIWELLKKFDKYKVSHSWRETNRAADFLSKMVLEGKDVVLWPADFPESLHNIIKEDAQGKIYYRG